MSRVTFTMPPGLETLDQRIFDSGARALEIAAEETVRLAKKDPDMPVASGAMRRGLSRSPVMMSGTTMVVQFIAPGPIGRATITMERGRRPGAYGPSPDKLAFPLGFRDSSWNDLAAMKGGWIWRKCREQVEALASELANKYLIAHPPRKFVTSMTKKGVIRHSLGYSKRKPPTLDYFRKKAVYVLARSKAHAVHDKGIRPHYFLQKYLPQFKVRFKVRFIQQLRSRVNETEAIGRTPRDERSTG